MTREFYIIANEWRLNQTFKKQVDVIIILIYKYIYIHTQTYHIFQSLGNACINPSLAKYSKWGSLTGSMPTIIA